MDIQYLGNAICADYLLKTNPGGLQEHVGHFYTQLSASSISTKNNIAISHLRGTAKRVTICEAKRHPSETEMGKPTFNWLTDSTWAKPLGELKLKRDMIKSRRSQYQAEEMYGIVAIGDKLRFYVLHQGNYGLAGYIPRRNQGGSLSADGCSTDRRDLTGPRQCHQVVNVREWRKDYEGDQAN